jgi:hypothetical protein
MALTSMCSKSETSPNRSVWVAALWCDGAGDQDRDDRDDERETGHAGLLG